MGLAEHLSMICKVLTLTKKSSIEGTERRKANERGINRRERANMQYKLKVNCTLLKTFQILKKKNGNGKWCDDKYDRAFRFFKIDLDRACCKNYSDGLYFLYMKNKVHSLHLPSSKMLKNKFESSQAFLSENKQKTFIYTIDTGFRM